MKHAREFKGKTNWKAVVMQSALRGEVGAIYRAVQTSGGIQALDGEAAIQCVARGNFEGLKLMLPHLTRRHYIKVLYHCASNGSEQGLKMCLQHANADQVVSALFRVIWNNQNALVPLVVNHLKSHVYNREERAGMIETAVHSGNDLIVKALLDLYPQSKTTVYSEAVCEAVARKNSTVLSLLLPSIKQLNPQQCAKAVTQAATHNDTAISYLLEHAVAPVFERCEVRRIASSIISLENMKIVLPYWSDTDMEDVCHYSRVPTDVREFIASYQQKKVLMLQVNDSAVERNRKI